MPPSISAIRASALRAVLPDGGRSKIPPATSDRHERRVAGAQSLFPSFSSDFRNFSQGSSVVEEDVYQRKSKGIPEENRAAKIIVCLRNPVERAFSHFWHERKKKKYNFDFSEVLRTYDLFSSLLEPGFYAEHIERFLGYFPREQILCQLFDHAVREGHLIFRTKTGERVRLPARWDVAELLETARAEGPDRDTRRAG